MVINKNSCFRNPSRANVASQAGQGSPRRESAEVQWTMKAAEASIALMLEEEPPTGSAPEVTIITPVEEIDEEVASSSQQMEPSRTTTEREAPAATGTHMTSMQQEPLSFVIEPTGKTTRLNSSIEQDYTKKRRIEKGSTSVATEKRKLNISNVCHHR